ncbi:MAG: hypothetical protein IT294_02830 [Deltaproteobacteria bacterium]|nr:hypothetical protein [Deltaproteobacteria bacterium]
MRPGRDFFLIPDDATVGGAPERPPTPRDWYTRDSGGVKAHRDVERARAPGTYGTAVGRPYAGASAPDRRASSGW